MTYDTDMDIIALSPFEPNAMFATTEDSDTIRRFTTLLDCGAVGGGSHHLRKVANTEGETFALKTLWPLSGCDENGSAVSPSGIKTLTEEYRNLAVVSLLGGFPKTYGYGYAGNTPVILMEWIEGLPLRDAAAELTDPAEGGRIPANTVAAIGKRLGEILLSTQKLDAPFVHRDISLRNIIIRTTRRPLAQQIAHCSFDLCLVDLGSSSIKRSDPSFTMSTGIWRNGTPEFAPPEMLSNDIPELGAAAYVAQHRYIRALQRALHALCRPHAISSKRAYGPVALPVQDRARARAARGALTRRPKACRCHHEWHP